MAKIPGTPGPILQPGQVPSAYPDDNGYGKGLQQAPVANPYYKHAYMFVPVIDGMIPVAGVETISLPEGDTPKVQLSQESTGVRFSFGIPKTWRGPEGIPGANGKDGANGANGADAVLPVFIPNRVIVSDAAGQLIESLITLTKLGYLSGVASDIQTQLDSKAAATHNHNTDYAPIIHTHDYQPADQDLLAIGGLPDDATGLLKKLGANTWGLDTSEYALAAEYVALAGGTMTGALRVKEFGDHNTIVTNSSTAGEYLFGGSPTDGGAIEDYVRVGRNKLQYKTKIGATDAVYDIYHAGNLSPLQGAKDANNFYGVVLPDGSAEGWLRSPTLGILPYQNGGNGDLGTSSWPFANIYGQNVFADTLDAGSFAQATGKSASWGITDGVNTGAFNARMGTGGGATWLLSGTSDGVFKCGIQCSDTNGNFRFYRAGNYYTLGGNSGTICHSGNFARGRNQITASGTTISFGKTFESIPTVVATYQESFTGDIGPIKITSKSTTGFTATIAGSSAARYIDWIAIGA